MNNDVTVILNGYKRPHRLAEQYDSAQSQSIPPKNIMYWQNTIPDITYDRYTVTQCVSAVCNENLGVWSRFAYALNARTNWVCILDDDTIPGNRWLENCLNTHETCPGLLGTIGVFFSDGKYTNGVRVGWDNPNPNPVKVDIVGHSWFFHRDLLSVFWRELPPLNQTPFVGEDIHFSHMIQKYTNQSTWVPPHPPDDHSLWGSLKGWQYGDDGLATAISSFGHMQEDLSRAIGDGFQLIESQK
jgi:hypothetical protein